MTASVAHVERSIRRILVPLDDPASSRDALSAATALAARVGAHLEGLFVEDVNLLRAAALPFATEISVPSGALQRIDRTRIEAQLRAFAEAARSALEVAAQPQRLAWSFCVRRGDVTVAVVEAATGADLVVVGRRTLRSGAAAAQLARAVAMQAPGSVYVTGARIGLVGPLAVAYDGSPAADEALEVVRAFAADGDTPVTVLVSAPTEQRARDLSEQARGRLGRDDVTVRWTGGDRLEHLIRAMREERTVLVVPKDAPLVRGGLDRLFDSTDGPLLLVR